MFLLKRPKTKQNKKAIRQHNLPCGPDIMNQSRHQCRLMKEQGGGPCRGYCVRPETNEQSLLPTKWPLPSIQQAFIKLEMILGPPCHLSAFSCSFPPSETWLTSTKQESTAQRFSYTHVLCKRYPRGYPGDPPRAGLIS